MALPELSHLQYHVLRVLLAGKRPGRDVRATLAKEGEKKSGPAFYQLMARMEEAGLVKGWYETREIDGQSVKERWYEVRGAGLRSYNATRDFYIRDGGTLGRLANA
jgi:hypothetical protein